MKAAFSGHEEIVKYLLCKGADIDILNLERKSVRDMSKKQSIRELIEEYELNEDTFRNNHLVEFNGLIPEKIKVKKGKPSVVDEEASRKKKESERRRKREKEKKGNSGNAGNKVAKKRVKKTEVKNEDDDEEEEDDEGEEEMNSNIEFDERIFLISKDDVEFSVSKRNFFNKSPYFRTKYSKLSIPDDGGIKIPLKAKILRILIKYIQKDIIKISGKYKIEDLYDLKKRAGKYLMAKLEKKVERKILKDIMKNEEKLFEILDQNHDMKKKMAIMDSQITKLKKKISRKKPGDIDEINVSSTKKRNYSTIGPRGMRKARLDKRSTSDNLGDDGKKKKSKRSKKDKKKRDIPKRKKYFTLSFKDLVSFGKNKPKVKKQPKEV